MQMEVLAPVGSKESLIAAVYSGADAVYFGTEEFNARRNADNFSKDSLKEIINFCKLNNVKTYLTLNILIKDEEINNALNLARTAYALGIDGIIVQDLGIAGLIHKYVPNLALHGSTQLSVHSAAALTLLNDMGFTRIVPAREMSKENLKALCLEASRLGIEVEVFVHGALCMCLSGQCYFSAHLGGRSANRGLCAGTCRLPFKAEGGTGYDLSLKDLSLVDHIKDLKDIGVMSLKIEGRMKGPEYVAASVNCIKQALTNGFVNAKDLELLEKVFSRSGFTDGYLNNKIGKEMFGIRTELDKNATSAALAYIHNLYRRPLQRVPVDFKIVIKENKPIEVEACCEGIKVVKTGLIPQKAVNRPLNEEAVIAAFKKLGGTPYFAQNTQVTVENGLMLPISDLNAIRKSIVAELDDLRTKSENTVLGSYSFAPAKTKKCIKGFFLRFANIHQAAFGCKNITGYSLPAEQIIKFSALSELQSAVQTTMIPAAELPRGADDDNFILELLSKVKALGVNTVVCSNLSSVSLAKKIGLNILGGFSLNLYNSASLKTAENLGINQGVISPELSFNEQQYVSSYNFKSLAFCYGRFPLMLTKNCPVKNGIGCKGKESYCKITDRKNETFPVICRNGYSEILNSRPTDLADSINQISADFGYLYFTLENRQEVLDIQKAFEQGKIYSKNFTRGLLKKGVL